MGEGGAVLLKCCNGFIHTIVTLAFSVQPPSYKMSSLLFTILYLLCIQEEREEEAGGAEL